MFFYGEKPTPEIRQTRDGRWRILLLSGDVPRALVWEGDARAAAEAALASMKSFDKPRPIPAGLHERPGPSGTTVRMRGSAVAVTDEEGAEIASATFVHVGWRHAMTTGARYGAMTASSIEVYSKSKWRRAGIAEAIHDMVCDMVGIPTVPNVVHGGPGSLSQLAQGFWAKRATRRPVPGLSGDSLEHTLRRSAALQEAQFGWEQEQLHVPGAQPDCCLAFALAASRLTGCPVVEGASPGGCQAWWIELPGGRALTSEGTWEPGRPPQDKASRECTRRFETTPESLAPLRDAWLSGDDGEALAVEADAWARAVLDRYGLLPPGVAPDRFDWRAEREAKFRRDVPILAANLLDGTPLPDPRRFEGRPSEISDAEVASSAAPVP